MSKLSKVIRIAITQSIVALLLFGCRSSLEGIGPAKPLADDSAADYAAAVVQAVVPEDSMTLPAAEPAKRFGYQPGSPIIDPLSIGAGIKEDIPYTYAADLEMSAAYVATMISDGWQFVSNRSAPDYIDMHLAKSGDICRVIVLSGYLKVFYPIRSSLVESEAME